MTKELRFACELADAADRITMRYWRTPLKIKTKSSWRDVVTTADFAVDRTLRAMIRKHFPDHGIISEEQELQPDVWEHEFVWVIDPIDGTSNFTMGLALFGTSIGLLRRGEPWLGVLSFPALHERYWAQRHSGAWMQSLQGKHLPCHVSKIRTLRESRFSFGYGNTIAARNYYLKNMPRLLRTARAGRDHHSAIFDFAALARGGLDFYICIDLYLWDVAGAWIIVQEAGGEIFNLQGKPFHRATQRIIATNGKISNHVLKFLR